MIRFARSRANIAYVHGAASNLSRFNHGTFDLVVASMSLMDIRYARRAIQEIVRVLTPQGRFVFALLHPCFNPNLGGWWPAGAKRPRFFTMDRYFDERRLIQRWAHSKLNTFEIPMYHRPLSFYTQALYDVGYGIHRLLEPRPTVAAIKQFPILAPAARVPYFIVAEAVKLGP